MSPEEIRARALAAAALVMQATSGTFRVERTARDVIKLADQFAAYIESGTHPERGA